MILESLTDSKVGWAGLTAAEIVDIATRAGSILVVPVGSIEQHGNHLPVSTDTVLANAVAMAGAEAVVDDLPILVAPPIYPGFSPHHLEFGGTLSLEFITMLTLVKDTVTTGLENGFDAVVLLNGHGGNMPLIGAATSTIGVNYPNKMVFGLTYFQLAAGFIDEIRDSDPGGMGHAGEFETSLMLHLQPGFVDMEVAEGTYLDDPNDFTLEDMFQGGEVSVYRNFSAYTESGAIGDPGLASEQKGAEIMERLRAELAAIFLNIHGEVTHTQHSE